VTPHAQELWKVDPESCCSAVKVGQLDRALAGKAAWMSGLRRDEAASRADTPIVARDLRGLVKVNPIATWSQQDVDGYIADHDVIVNPLHAQGYLSIGCQPCTHLPTDPNDPRSGRWVGQDKTECGLHDCRSAGPGRRRSRVAQRLRGSGYDPAHWNRRGAVLKGKGVDAEELPKVGRGAGGHRAADVRGVRRRR